MTSYTIAVIDDDEPVLESLTNLLESHGHSVLTYVSATAFLADDVLADIDCVISDVSMPGMDGFQLQRRLAEERPGLPVVLMTARPDIGGDYTPSSRRSRAFLQKPFDGTALLDALTAAMRDSR